MSQQAQPQPQPQPENCCQTCLKCYSGVCPYKAWVGIARPFCGAECLCPRASIKCFERDGFWPNLCVPALAFMECIFYQPVSWAMHGCQLEKC